VLTCLRRGLLGLVGGTIALTSCGGDGEPRSYGPEHRAGFVEDCAMGEVTTGTCGCFYDRLALEVPFDRFERLEETLREPRAAADVPTDLAAMAAGCAALHQGAAGG
jgi:hypothetical protein